ncbi:MAG: DUF1598 domain-containing protein [Thermoguttaceae bacterium]|jgi:hypothetical protein
MRTAHCRWALEVCCLGVALLWLAVVVVPRGPAWGQAGAANNNNNNNNPANPNANPNALNNAFIGGVNPFLMQRPVGGVSINADGLLENSGTDVLGRLSQLRKRTLQGLPADLQEAVPLRKISLRRMDEAVAAAVAAGKPVSNELALLGGLQQIRYVFVYPEQHDIVLVGPAEGWKVDARGNIVGATTGRPLMLLDDLLVALRSAAGPGQAGITCSIDPTKEGLQQLHSRLATMHTIGNPERTAAEIERALGRQDISFTGVPASSHFAAVLVAADYRMKRLAMNFDKSPIRGLPSFLNMISGGGRTPRNIMPRWWLEPKYESVLRDPAGLAWELGPASVKCLTEEGFLAANGKLEQAAEPNPLAQKWAENMTEHYAELAVAEPIFGELRNCMELAVVGALVARERLTERAACSLPTLLADSAAKTLELAVPKQVDSKVSMLKRGRNWIISASGGVAIRSMEIVGQSQPSAAPAAARSKAVPSDSAKWFWN